MHVLPVTAEYGMGVLAWSPLGSGWLSGAVREGQEIATNRAKLMPQRFDLSIPANRARLDAVEKLAGVAEQAGLTMIQLALGFVTAHPAVTSAIIGPRTVDHLRSALGDPAWAQGMNPELPTDDEVLDNPYQYTDYKSDSTHGARGTVFGEPGSGR